MPPKVLGLAVDLLVVSSRPPARPPSKAKPSPTLRLRVTAFWRRPWARKLFVASAALAVVGFSVLVYLWISYGRIIDRKLAGEQRPVPRIFGRALELRPGLAITANDLVTRLNDIGYAQRAKATAPGEFNLTGSVLTLVPRTAADAPRVIRAEFARPTSTGITKLGVVGGGPVDRVQLEAPLLAALAAGQRRRYVALTSIPQVMIDAVVSIEDRRFFEHPGVDPIGAIGAVLTNLRGDKPYLVGGSTLTQQIVKNTFLTPDKTYRRKLQEQFMALVLESRFTKKQILELYLNEVVLGQRGPFEIRGVPEAARVFFGKDVRNITLAEAATIAGIIQSPSRLSPLRNPDRARERRNVVLREMADGGAVSRADSDKAAAEPLTVAARAFDNEAPYFVDYVSQLVDDQFAGLLKKDAAVDVYTTLDLQLQRQAQESIAEGIAAIDKQLAARKKTGTAQAALVAIDPRTGAILAMVGGRAYDRSQFNRAVVAKRQPGSTFKPFVYLAAFEDAAAGGDAGLTPASVIDDEPTSFKVREGEPDYEPANYQNEYAGPVTLRRALAQSRNIVAIKVAEQVGYDKVAALWRKVGVGTPARAFPSIALGVFEASPVDMASAYTLFMNNGAVRPLQSITRISENGQARTIPAAGAKQVARADTTFLVTNMMRSVIDEGTGAAARGAGFALNAAGKSGTTNDLRDAWFIGFTPELLAVVWVGFDDNKPIGMSGTQAALPIWTAFMKRALVGHPDQSFEAPSGIVYADIDRETGKLATSACPRILHEAFLAGHVPQETCDLHGSAGLQTMVSGIRRFFGRILR